MNRVRLVTLLTLLLFAAAIACAQAPASGNAPSKPGAPLAPSAPGKLGPGTYAVMKTTLGTMTFKLFTDLAPKTCENFIGLSEGTKPWKDPATGATVKRSLYRGTIFHRVIKDFMVQGGDPLGTGYGDPGYRFVDEFAPSLRFDRDGLLAMANSGPNTNGSQFFVTVRATPHLNNRHTIFGEIVEGKDVLKKIALTPTREGSFSTDYPKLWKTLKAAEPSAADAYRDRPVQDVVVESITIQRVK
jgi:peptidyl-prolyl cis-trans isomerase A (cyclophilin A)